MLTSQYVMLITLAAIAIAWTIAFRAPGPRKIVTAIFIQAAAAALLTFSTDNLFLSILLVAIILAAVAWMIRSGHRLTCA
jgi:hypothetical protein